MIDSPESDALAGQMVGLIDGIIDAARLLAPMAGLDRPDVQNALARLRENASLRAVLDPPKLTTEATDRPTMPCPKCGDACAIFDHTGVLCFECNLSFNSEAPDDVTAALDSTDPDVLAWIDRIRKHGWRPPPDYITANQRRFAQGQIPAGDWDIPTPPSWHCPDCGRRSFRKTAAAARSDIHRQKNAAGHLALCRCPNLQRYVEP